MKEKVGKFFGQRFCRLYNTSRDYRKITVLPEKKAHNHIKKYSDMGRRSKAVQSRVGNFGQPPKTQKARPDDVTDSDSESEGQDNDYLPSNHPEDLPIRQDVDPDDYRFILFENYVSDDDIEGLSDLEEPDDSDLEDELEDYPSQEIRNDANLLQFSAILAEAQKVAVKLEQEHDELKPKRLKHYMGNAVRTK